ncbi:hypothetical protein COV19_05435 [Candidatus Woesearchaeota archaeon CG10_big_fil_rev_8_21_14_0_10_44_13]|nr:MAG: hypothetical protein COV19_05435 [Candidatus Woesearchaeota archaeon CG10_big_fil_rev_8_21_14_0_10_44_13]
MTNRTNRCILCGSGRKSKEYAIGSKGIYKCDSCGLIFTLPQNRLTQFSEKQKAIYEGEMYRKMYFSIRKKICHRAEKRLEEISSYRTTGSILDEGCSYGFFLEVASEKGWESYGTEINKPAADYSRKLGAKVSNCFTEDAKLKKNFFDAITMWDVLEHTENPVKHLIFVRGLLKKGGIIAVQLPNIDSIASKIAGKKWAWLCPDDHMYHFSVKTLTRAIKEAGYDMIEMRTWEDPTVIVDSIVARIKSDNNKAMNSAIDKIAIPFYIFMNKVGFLFYPYHWIIKKYNKGGLILAYAKNK